MTNRYDLMRPNTFIHECPYAGRIFKNVLHPYVGFRILMYIKNVGFCWNTTEHQKIQGDVGSPAHKLYEFIESDFLKEYPLKEPGAYHMFSGPNSNTFTQWVVDQVPEAGLTLPWNAWGKGYK